MTQILPGIEKMAAERPELVRGRRIGLVAHPASVDSRLRHSLDIVLDLGARVEQLFGPEHGFAGEAQDMEPVDGAALVFKTDDRSVPEGFAENDPYVKQGLVKSWKVRQWAVVIGGE